MTYFGYVDRQKQKIRDRHTGEEVLISRAGSRVLRGADLAIPSYACPADENKSVEQLLAELASLKGLNTAERERFLSDAAL